MTSTGAVHAFADDALGEFAPVHSLTASTSEDVFTFGRRFGLADGRLVASHGAATDVYRRDPGGWSLEQAIPGPASRTVTGASTDGTRAVVTSRSSMAPYGLAHVYVQDPGGAWALEQVLEPDLMGFASPSENGTAFKSAIEGETLVLAAQRWNGGDGRVFVYERSGGTWTQSQLFMSDLQPTQFDMNFGQLVRLDGNTLVVAEEPSSGNPSTLRNGRVFVYERASATADFVQTQIIEDPTPSVLDHFGSAVALSGDYLATYAPQTDRVAVHRRSAGVFVEVWSDVVPDVGPGMAMDADRLAVGVTGAEVDGLAGVGEIRVYERQPGDSYALEDTFRPRRRFAGLGLGLYVAMEGGRVVASSYQDDQALYDFAL